MLFSLVVYPGLTFLGPVLEFHHSDMDPTLVPRKLVPRAHFGSTPDADAWHDIQAFRARFVTHHCSTPLPGHYNRVALSLSGSITRSGVYEGLSYKVSYNAHI